MASIYHFLSIWLPRMIDGLKKTSITNIQYTRKLPSSHIPLCHKAIFSYLYGSHHLLKARTPSSVAFSSEWQQKLETIDSFAFRWAPYITLFSLQQCNDLRVLHGGNTSTPIMLNWVLGRPIQGQIPHCRLCQQVDSGLVECVGRSMFWHIWPNRNSNPTLTQTLKPNSNSDGKVQDIDIPTFNVRNIDVLKVDFVELNLPEQSPLQKSRPHEFRSRKRPPSSRIPSQWKLWFSHKHVMYNDDEPEICFYPFSLSVA